MKYEINPENYVDSIIGKIATKVTETEEELIWSTIENWATHNCELSVRRLNKKEFIDAMRKASPVKPIVYEVHPKPIMLCGECTSSFIIGAYGAKMTYCPNCGRKVDWSEQL